MRDALSGLHVRKPRTTALFAVVLVTSSVLFGFTAAGHYSSFETTRIDATVTGYSIDDSGSEPLLDVRVRIENPLLRPIQVGNAGLTARVDGDEVATSGGVYVGETVDAGDTKTITISLRPNNDEAERMRTAAADGEIVVTGSVRGSIEDEDIRFGVTNSSQGGAGE